MNLKDSVITTTTLTRIYPLVVLFSLYLMSYGGAFPGGGFQGGVVLGTMIVILETALEKRLYPDSFFCKVELVGVLILAGLLVVGWLLTGYPFGIGYTWSTESLILGNVMIWLLSCAIYLEVSGSMVLIFRRFLFWREFKAPLQEAASRPPGKCIKLATVLTLIILAALIYFRAPSIELVFHGEVETFRALTLDFGIQNMVTTVYLGPRMVDTILEVSVVLMTVFGLHAIGGQA